MAVGAGAVEAQDACVAELPSKAPLPLPLLLFAVLVVLLVLLVVLLLVVLLPVLVVLPRKYCRRFGMTTNESRSYCSS